MPRQLKIQRDAVLQRQQPQRLQSIALSADLLTLGPAQRIARHNARPVRSSLTALEQITAARAARARLRSRRTSALEGFTAG